MEMVKEGERMGTASYGKESADSAEPLLSLFASALPSGCQGRTEKFSPHVNSIH